ncbi:MAG: WD40 repeat domain-containing protein, partial [Planctomycetota bacterium]
AKFFNRLTEPSTAVERVKWSPNGKPLAAAGHQSQVIIWDAASESVVQQFERHADVAPPDRQSIVQSISWSPDQQLVATACQSGQVFVWKPTTGEIVAEYKEPWLISSLDWHPTDPRLVIGCCDDKTVKVWDFQTDEEPTKVMQFDTNIVVVRWSPDGDRIAAASQNGDARIIDLGQQGSTVTLGDHTGGVTDLAWHPGGDRIATASEDLTVKIWDAASGAQTLSFVAHDGAATCVAWSPDGKQLASCGEDFKIKFWDASLGYERSGLR